MENGALARVRAVLWILCSWCFVCWVAKYPVVSLLDITDWTPNRWRCVLHAYLLATQMSK